jgi:arylsulfatase A-like enzyme
VGVRPNILIALFDTLSAENMSVYGYSRDTTPNLKEFASRSTVYHRHFAGGNFTTSGTSSLLTGAYPWSHRAFNISAVVDSSYESKNLFNAFADSGYYRLAYTHNFLANHFLQQFHRYIDLHLEPDTYFLTGTPPLHKVFKNDKDTAYRSSNFLMRLVPSESIMPGSMFLSLLNETWLEQYEASFNSDLASLFPEGLPEEGNSKSFFLLEQAIDGMENLVKRVPQPFLAYFHLYPPHHPYHPRREFIGRFDDQWTPESKSQHFFSMGETDGMLSNRRRRYDEYVAYVDAEFGRFVAHLQQSGLLENTLVVFTSDHGEMFERGIKGHNTPVLFNPLVRIPLLVHYPGQTQRVDIHQPTSCTDVLPTLAQAAGLPIPDWCEGMVLPNNEQGSQRDSRSVFSLEARRNSKYRPLTVATISMVKGQFKLAHYFGYPGYENQYELYDMGEDLLEQRNIFSKHDSISNELRDELNDTLQVVKQAFLLNS